MPWREEDKRLIDGIKNLPSFNQSLIDAMEDRKDSSKRLYKYVMDVVRATREKADRIIEDRYGEYKETR